jgi:hypothetical protein
MGMSSWETNMSDMPSANAGAASQPRAVDEETMADQLLRRVQTLERDKSWWQKIGAGSGCVLVLMLAAAVLLVAGVSVYYGRAMKRQQAHIVALELEMNERALMEKGEWVKVWVAKKTIHPLTEVDKSYFELRSYPKAYAPDALTENDDLNGRIVHLLMPGYPVTKGHYEIIPTKP